MKKHGYHNQAIKRHYGGELRGLSHSQLYRDSLPGRSPLRRWGARQ